MGKVCSTQEQDEKYLQNLNQKTCRLETTWEM